MSDKENNAFLVGYLVGGICAFVIMMIFLI